MQYNIFNHVHLPLKRCLLSASVYLNNIEEPINYEEVFLKITEVLDIFKEQLEFEETTILPLVFEYEPSIVSNYVKQHKKQLALAHELETHLGLFKNLIYQFQSLSAFELINDAFNDFMLANYHHMDDEEEIINEILKLYYNDGYLLQIEQRMKSHPALVSHELKSNILQAKAA